ncbi:hypothetical protein N7455_003995 [Penicillium solitum]|uniref:uncharacterized protein n=1 Tax=Penicillium solitum TaxID=60172 RepID=UPI00185E4095|nr:hypothetical protein HAV15_003488 [Penicillium sp. str. \
MTSTQKHALVVGASGITGYGLLQNLLSYPTADYWTSITGLTSRPMDKAQALLPDEFRLRLVSGLNLNTPHAEAVVAFLKAIPQIELITHVYFAAYSVKDCENLQDIKRLNTTLLSNLIEAVDACCPNLQFVTLQTGGKYYGVQFPKDVSLNPPFKESFPRIPQPLANEIFYYAQIDLMTERSKGKSWKWADIRPDAIVGFVPQNNAMGIAQALAVFLSLYRYVHGDGAKVPFPGDLASFKAKHTDTSQDILTRFTIFVSLNAEKTNGHAYNIGCSDECTSWESKWSGICEYFGLEGVSPQPDHTFSVSRWIEDHRAHCQRWVEEFQLREGAFEGTSWDFLEALVAESDFDRQYDLSAARSLRFHETIDTVDSYHKAFDRYRQAKIIP